MSHVKLGESGTAGANGVGVEYWAAGFETIWARIAVGSGDGAPAGRAAALQGEQLLEMASAESSLLARIDGEPGLRPSLPRVAPPMVAE
jgi:hypothetical protein